MLAKYLFILWMANVIANDYTLIYVQMLVDEGQTAPNNLDSTGESHWKKKCYENDANSIPGCLTETSKEKIRSQCAIDFKNVYKSKLNWRNENNECKFQSIAKQSAKIASNQFSDELVNKKIGAYVANEQHINSDYPCELRDTVLKMAKAPGTKYRQLIDKAEFKTLLEGIKSKTKKDATVDNYLDRINDLAVEADEFDNKQDIRNLINSNNDTLIDSFKYQLGLFDEPLYTNVDVDEKIRMSRIAPVFNYTHSSLDQKKQDPSIPSKLHVFITNAITINSMLVALGLGNTLTQLEDYMPKAGSNLIFELYQNNQESTDIAFKVVRMIDRSTSVNLTEGILGCEGKEHCPYDVLQNISMKYQEKFECSLPPNNSLYFVPVETTLPTTPNVIFVTQASKGCPESCEFKDFSCMLNCGHVHVVWYIVGGFFLVIAVVLIIVCVRFRPCCKKTKTVEVIKEQIKLIEDTHWIDWINRAYTKGISLLITEFDNYGIMEGAPDTQVTIQTFVAFDAHPTSNRYADIKCLDQTRIVVQADRPSHDYYHANYVGEANEQRVICAQSPMTRGKFGGKDVEDTVVQFLKLIIQEKVTNVVMLGGYKHRGQLICAEYFDKKTNGVKNFEENGTRNTISVKNMGPSEQPISQGVTSIKLELVYKKETTTIVHHQWEDWEYRKVPSSFDIPLDILNNVAIDPDHPPLFHCPDGAGQSGTLAAIWLVRKTLNDKKDISDFHFQIRRQLYNAIGTPLQYLYVIHVLLNKHSPTYLPKEQTTLNKWNKQYQLECDKLIIDNFVVNWVKGQLELGANAILEKFKEATLDKTAPCDGNKAHKYCGRYKNIKCYDKHRVILTYPGVPHDFIHANYVGTNAEPKRFIVTQGPLDGKETHAKTEDTQFSFWAMILQEKVEHIVMLGKCVEDGVIKVSQYWPTIKKFTFTGAKGATITVKVKEKQSIFHPKHTFIHKTMLEVIPSDKTIETRIVEHLQWTTWQDYTAPSNLTTANDLLDEITKSSNPIVLHCSAGIGRSGSLAAIWVLGDSMMTETRIGNIANYVREYRRHAVQTAMQFLYIHYNVIVNLVESSGFVKKNINDKKYRKFGEDYEKLNEESNNNRMIEAEKARKAEMEKEEIVKQKKMEKEIKEQVREHIANRVIEE